MDKIIITGGRQLNGDVKVSGSKNAVLPLMASALLTDKCLTLRNIPRLSDLTRMSELLICLGAQISENFDEKTIRICASHIKSPTAPYDIVNKMRASIVVLGPLLARCGVAKVSLPGGCAIGARPVNIHIDGLRLLGADVFIDGGYINARAPKNGLIGTTITLPIVTVTGTENILMASVLAKGRTILQNAAKEPEVCDLVRCLVAMGARIEGIGTDTLIIDGVDEISGTEHTVIPDRIEAATYAIASAITHGDVLLKNVIYDDLLSFWDHLERTGASITRCNAGVRVKMVNDIKGVDVMTEPYPGYPTDLQAQFMALMTLCSGASMITETIFENRFMHVAELCRMSANITMHKTSVLVRGVKKLIGAPVMATDLRASVACVLAGLAATGETTVQRVYHLDRGYEQLEHKLSNCGAIIARV
ncbi:MAG: UDP-N-acetylglucosamine 1-carboxyvinyltransferase [Holosporales bacterium]|jgi:UDP-N-acetylglucosamine 1-carboxyvinyltransferase|nr:UDP-N-acetylglucosamine 1-carboxyvinyltransferase [Holosporales bacterium]